MRRMRLFFITCMMILILGLAMLLLPITAYAQPPADTVGSLQFDTLTFKDHVLRCEIRHNGTTLPPEECVYNPMNGQTRVASPNGYPPGPHEWQVRVYYEAFTYVDPTTGTETVYNEGWSGWSNICMATKPEILGLRISGNYIVADPQTDAVSGKVYIDGAEHSALVELSPDQQDLRLYDISALSPGTYNVYANITISHDNENFYAGDFQAVPFVVTVGVALPVPANLKMIME